MPDTGQPAFLVVDDDAAVLEMLGGQIVLAGYRVELFTNPLAAAARISASVHFRAFRGRPGFFFK